LGALVRIAIPLMGGLAGNSLNLDRRPDHLFLKTAEGQ